MQSTDQRYQQVSTVELRRAAPFISSPMHLFYLGILRDAAISAAAPALREDESKSGADPGFWFGRRYRGRTEVPQRGPGAPRMLRPEAEKKPFTERKKQVLTLYENIIIIITSSTPF